MLHLVQLPAMKSRVAILQAQFLRRSLYLPDDTLLSTILPALQATGRRSHWTKLSQSPLWRCYCKPQVPEGITLKQFYTFRDSFLDEQFTALCGATGSLLLSSCRLQPDIDPILWLPMTRSERSRVLRWRLGWLPGGKPTACIFHPSHNWSRHHAFDCLHVHQRLFLPHTISDPISFLLNQLPRRKPRTHSDCLGLITHWPIVCTILHELDYFFRGKCPPPPIDPGAKLLDWLPK